MQTDIWLLAIRNLWSLVLLFLLLQPSGYILPSWSNSFCWWMTIQWSPLWTDRSLLLFGVACLVDGFWTGTSFHSGMHLSTLLHTQIQLQLLPAFSWFPHLVKGCASKCMVPRHFKYFWIVLHHTPKTLPLVEPQSTFIWGAVINPVDHPHREKKGRTSVGRKNQHIGAVLH